MQKDGKDLHEDASPLAIGWVRGFEHPTVPFCMAYTPANVSSQVIPR